MEYTEDRLPSVRSIYCCGYRYHEIDCQIVIYDPPNPHSLQFLSLEPLNLSPDLCLQTFSAVDYEKVENNFKSQPQNLNTTNQNIFNKLKKHLRTSSYKNNASANNDIECLLEKANLAIELIEFLQTHRNKKLKHWFLRCINVPVFLKKLTILPLLMILLVLRVIFEIILVVINFEISSEMRMVDVFSSAQQTNVRLQQLCFWPWQFKWSRQRIYKYTSLLRVQYIK